MEVGADGLAPRLAPRFLVRRFAERLATLLGCVIGDLASAGFPAEGVGGVVAPGLVSGSPVGSLVGILVGWLGREGSGRLRELGAAAILRLARYRCEPKNLSGTLMAAGPSLAVGWVVEGRLAPRSVAPSLVVMVGNCIRCVWDVPYSIDALMWLTL